MPSYEINIKTTDDPRGIHNATENTIELTDAMGKLLERAQRKEEFAAAKESLAGMTEEQKQAALASYRLHQAHGELHGGLTNLERAVAGTRSTIGGLNSEISVFGQNIGTSADLLDGLGVSIPINPMQLFGQAIQTVGTFVKDSINEFAAYIEEIDRIATYTGMTSEETSRLMEVSGDLRIEVNSLTMALKGMSEQGTTPSIEGLAQLSDRYLALEDPLLRAQFLTDNFGRAGVEMARLMELGSEQIHSLTSEVEDFMIVTGKSREEAEAYMLALDGLNDAAMGLKYTIAQALVPSLTELLKMLTGPSADQAANFINTVFAGTFIETPAARSARLETQASAGAAQETAQGGGRRGNIFDPDYQPQARTERVQARAGGGPVEAGRLYAINENRPWTGPEYFLAPSDGMVYPSAASLQAGSGPTISVQLIYSPGISLATQQEAEETLVPYIRAALRNL